MNNNFKSLSETIQATGRGFPNAPFALGGKVVIDQTRFKSGRDPGRRREVLNGTIVKIGEDSAVIRFTSPVTIRGKVVEEMPMKFKFLTSAEEVKESAEGQKAKIPDKDKKNKGSVKKSKTEIGTDVKEFDEDLEEASFGGPFLGPQKGTVKIQKKIGPRNSANKLNRNKVLKSVEALAKAQRKARTKVKAKKEQIEFDEADRRVGPVGKGGGRRKEITNLSFPGKRKGVGRRTSQRRNEKITDKEKGNKGSIDTGTKGGKFVSKRAELGA